MKLICDPSFLSKYVYFGTNLEISMHIAAVVEPFDFVDHLAEELAQVCVVH